MITIIVEDTNDNSPEFVSVPTGLLSAATSPGTKITTVLATDRYTTIEVETDRQVVADVWGTYLNFGRVVV